MLTWLVLVTLAEAKKSKTPPPPPVGWHREEGWKGDCYFPPDFDKMLESDRKAARQTALEQMILQWRGDRDDGMSLDADTLESLEIAHLSKPTFIESTSRSNLEKCKTYMTGGDAGAWQSWLSALVGEITAGDCKTPAMTYTLFDYLDINKGWQRPIPMCKGDKAKIWATTADKYRLSDSAPWITAEGDPNQRATTTEYPCNIEGCYVGMLVGRFVTDTGTEIVFPIGAEKYFTAPDHGTLTWSINDNSWYDNRYFKSATIEDRTAVTIEPAE